MTSPPLSQTNTLISMKMNNISRILCQCIGATLMLLQLSLLTSCEDDNAAPYIESVWFNMVSQPIEQAPCAYPGQTLCLHGEHLDDLRRLIVNGTDINLNTLFVYESDNYITFQLPSDVRTKGDKIRVVTAYGMYDFPFIVRPASEQPAISTFSATTLIGGRTLTITGSNLDGVQEVWLPLTYGERVQCNVLPAEEDAQTTVRIIIPEGVDFATGSCEIVMQKTDYERGITYTEKVYSTTTDFRN